MGVMKEENAVENGGEAGGTRGPIASRGAPSATTRSVGPNDDPMKVNVSRLSPDGSEGTEAGESSRALVGKIARLPKTIREKLNQRLDNGEPSSETVPWLNGLPEVKAVLAAHFGGAAINHRNISNWRANGYKRWQQRQELLDEVKEMAEESKDVNEASGDGLMRMTAAMACTKLLRLLRSEKITGAEVGKIAFAIAALNNVEMSHVRVKHEERRLDQKDELVTLAWDKHLRDCAAIAERIKGDEQIAAVKQAPIDYSAKIELIGRRMFGPLWRKRKVGSTTSGECKSQDSDLKESNESDKTDGTDGQEFVPTVTHDSSEVSQENAGRKETAATQRGPATVLIDPATESSPLANARGPVTTSANPHQGKATQDVIGECEDNFASERAARLNRRRQKEAREDGELNKTAATQRGPTVTAARELSPYEKALLKGKTFIEALYAQFTPVKKPQEKQPQEALNHKPNPPEGVMVPIYYPPDNGPTYPLPPPFYGPCDPPPTLFLLRGWNSLW